ncbi:hypothetical protein QTO34_003013 [Cnephaeus nilssonii]|uniref:Uncharacterized protein n=1 Tax=Cnephaeus nilssonii TaxID=3371016 RepID=A0AA40HUA9_CNENI|nr:hypothetical protein QTO34_003013 [Eptesicus nilssonii]
MRSEERSCFHYIKVQVKPQLLMSKLQHVIQKISSGCWPGTPSLPLATCPPLLLLAAACGAQSPITAWVPGAEGAGWQPHPPLLLLVTTCGGPIAPLVALRLNQWGIGPPPCSLSAWEPCAVGRSAPARRLVACTHLGLVLSTHLLHHPTPVQLSSGPIGACSAECRPIACHVPCRPLVISAHHSKDLTELLQSHDKTLVDEELLPMDEQRPWFLRMESTGKNAVKNVEMTKDFRVLYTH